ncbi:MAG: hypothetical protein HN976_24275 [Lentisphaerae bacterium]|nr:hypothetical protein [Lentisphaerota bacterium]
MSNVKRVLLATALALVTAHWCEALEVTNPVHSASRAGTTATVSGSFSFTGSESFALQYSLPAGWTYVEESGAASSGSKVFAYNATGNELACFFFGTPSSPLYFSFDVTLPSIDASGVIAGDVQYTDAQGNPQPPITIGSDLSFPIYTLTVVDGTGDGQYGPNTVVVIAADAPPAGHSFSQWTTGDGGTLASNAAASTTYTMPANDASVAATYEINAYTLTVASDHGAPTPAVGAHTYDWGTDVTCTVTSPDTQGTTRYVCSGWTGTGSVPTTDTGTSAGPFTVTQGSVITWNWGTEYWLDTEVAGNGSVDVVDDWQSAGASVTITATPAANHHFTEWTGATAGCTINGTQIAAPMTQARTITANFAINTYEVAFQAGANGTVNPVGAQTVDHGADCVAVTATAAANYHFAQWNDGNTENPRTVINVTAAATYTAQFAIDTYEVTFLAGANGSVAPAGVQMIDHGANSAAVTATAAANHHFVQWNDGNTDNPRTVFGVTATVAYTAEFAIDTYEVTFHAGAHGALAGGDPDVTVIVDHGDPAPAAPGVTPDDTYRFTGWDPVLPGTITAAVATTAQYELDYHTADYLAGGDWKIGVQEVIRIIELYKANAYHCDAGSADGYAPGGGDQTGTNHSADYLNDGNWKIDVLEVSRVIELYEANAYHWDSATADGYAPGAGR